MHRQLARTRPEDKALNADDVAQIPLFKPLVHAVGQVITAHINLHTPGHILQMCKTCFAHHPARHHAAGYLYRMSLLGERVSIKPSKFRENVLGHGVAPKVVRISVALFTQFRELVATLAFLFIQIIGHGENVRLSLKGHTRINAGRTKT